MMNNQASNTGKWVYAKDANWIQLDEITQECIEILWVRNHSSYIESPSFKEPVYIDISQMVLVTDNYQHTIVRRQSTSSSASDL